MILRHVRCVICTAFFEGKGVVTFTLQLHAASYYIISYCRMQNVTLVMVLASDSTQHWQKGPNKWKQIRPHSVRLKVCTVCKYEDSHGRLPRSPRQNKAIKNGTPGALQQRWKEWKWTDITCDASPSTLTTKTMEAASKEFQHLVLFDSI